MQSRTTTRLLKTVTAILALTFFANQDAIAQITAYTRTVLAGQTFTPIATGTIINTNAQLSPGMSGNQDDGVVLVNLPFTFTYNGTNFTQVSFCTNGWIGMGNQTTSVTAAQGRAQGNLFTTTVPNNTIAAWFGDMGANFPGLGSMVHGLVANDVYAFEWRNAVGSGFSVTTANLINFMIKIYGPGSIFPGRIEMLYGPRQGTTTTGRTIGIEDATGGANHFINAVNGSFTLTTTSGWPGDGNGYRFDPPVAACSGVPVAGTIISPTSVCAGNFTLSLTGHSYGPGVNYQWQSRPAGGGAFTNIGTNSAALTTNITAATDFRCIVTCANSGQTATTAVVTVGFNNFYICYCKNGLGGNTAVSIDSVSIWQTTLNNASLGTAPGSYTLYPISGNTTANIQAGGLYYIYVAYGADAKGSAWLDLNRNGTFENTEWVQINTTGKTGLAVVKIPPTATPGLTGLRIRSTDPSAANAAANACTGNGSGETEDYVVNITPAPTNDLRLVTLLSPGAGNPSVCPFTDVPVKAVIYNNGSNAQNGFTITADLTGPITSSNTVTYTKVLPAFTTDTITFPSYSFNVTGSFNVRAYIKGGVDLDASNDTSANTPFKVAFTANLPLVSEDSVCYGETALLTLRADTVEHHWYRTLNATTPFYMGDTVTIPNMQGDSVLYVSSRIHKVSGSLTTLNGTNNNCTAGAMFDIVPNKTVFIDSFAALFTTTGSQVVNIYYRVGGYSGFETNTGAWTLLASVTVNATSTTNFTIVKIPSPLLVTPGSTYGIYMNYNSAYTNGTGTYANADMQINAGAGFCTAFTSPIAGRIFNGTVYYSKGSDMCESPKQKVTAHAGPQPVANLGVDLLVCDDVDITLDAGHAGAGYIWSTGERTQTITFKNSPGTYWVLLDKYCVSTDTIEITRNPLPSVTGISYQKTANEYRFSAAGAQDIKSFIWLFGDGASETGTLTPVHTYATENPYRVTLILFNDCGSDTTYLDIPVGIKHTAANDVSITLYPNPASNNLSVDIQGMDSDGDISIVNGMGSIVHRQTGVHTGKTDIDISKLPAGNYILRLGDGTNSASRPFVISR